jgi:phosphoribosylanthranilate isomerase
MTLIVALPENDPEMAEAAVRGGADTLQLHINISHFKTFYEEKKNLKEIMENTVIPVGIVPGLDVTADKDEMDEMKKMGFDFFNIDLEKVPPFMMKLKGISKVLALNDQHTLDKLMASDHKADALDAAIIPASGKGKNLVVGDLQNYISIILSAGIPVIIPTQRNIRPSEVAIISDTGAKGLLLTSVVTGSSAKDIEKVVKEYRMAVDDLGD